IAPHQRVTIAVARGGVEALLRGGVSAAVLHDRADVVEGLERVRVHVAHLWCSPCRFTRRVLVVEKLQVLLVLVGRCRDEASRRRRGWRRPRSRPTTTTRGASRSHRRCW